MKTNSKSKLAVIVSAYDKLAILDNIRMESYRKGLFKRALEEEKGAWNESTPSLPPSKRAKVHMVIWIAQFMNGEAAPTIKDYISYRESIYYAASLVENYRKEIAEAWDIFDISVIAKFDYAQIVLNGS